MKHKKRGWCVYILECEDKTLYTGSTNDLKKRLKQHNELKTGARYTRVRRPVVLRYFERLDTLGEARSRELKIKSWRREKKIEMIKGVPSSQAHSG